MSQVSYGLTIFDVNRDAFPDGDVGDRMYWELKDILEKLETFARAIVRAQIVTAVPIEDFTDANHDHSSASEGGNVDHTDLTNKGTNTHSQIDTHIASQEVGDAEGQMFYWNHSSTTWKHTEVNELFWDDTNKRLGISTNTPRRILDLLDASNPQLRLTHTDNSIYIDMQADSNGDLIISCIANKTLELQQAVYDDIYLPVAITKPGGTAPTWAVFHGNLKQYTFAINDFVEGSFELKHNYKEGTDLNLHVHIVTNGAEASVEARYSIEYWIADMDEASTTTTTLTSTDKALTNADGHHEYIDLGDISGTNIKIGAIVCYLLKRVALVDGSDPAADPFVVSVGCHYQIDTLGSRQETIK